MTFEEYWATYNTPKHYTQSMKRAMEIVARDAWNSCSKLHDKKTVDDHGKFVYAYTQWDKSYVTPYSDIF